MKDTKDQRWFYIDWKGSLIELAIMGGFILISIGAYTLIGIKSKYYGFLVGSILLVLLLSFYYIRQLKLEKVSIFSYMVNILLVIIVFNLAMAAVYFLTSPNLGYLEYSNSTIIKQLDYSTALYFGGVTFTTLGFGDIHPQGNLRFIAILQALFGWITLAMLILGINKYVVK